MGKAQSKRSVDITTETTKKGPDGGDEVTGKLEKIEDIDAKQVNGDATPQEKNDTAGEKKDAPDETENEKDLTTEKAAAENTATPSPTEGGGGDQINPTATESSPKEDVAAAATTTPPPAAQEGAEEITPLADESLNKKAKKEKPKKKWSFRSISFGKKDKQKPVKNEGSENAAENATAAVNGETTETNKPAEGAAAETTKNETDEEAKPVEKAEEKVENGVAIEKEQEKEQQKQMNGQKTPPTTPIDDAESKKPIETSTNVAVVNETATTTTVVANNDVTISTPVPVPAPTPSPSQAEPNSSTETAKDSHVDKIEAVISNGTAADAEKNGVVHAEEEEEAEAEEDVKETKTAAQTEVIKSVIPPPSPVIDEKPHQNGTNGDEGVEEITAATKTLQIEVKTEQEYDSVKSTITTITSMSTNTTNTITTIIPDDDNLNSEQNNTINDNLFITSAQTDTNTTNTTDKSLTSNNSIAINADEEQLSSVCPQNKVLDNIIGESTPAIIIETIETATVGDIDAILPPPPLPLSAPPSQVAIFALKDNNENDESEKIEPENPSDESIVENNVEENLTKSSIEIPINVVVVEVESLIDEPTTEVEIVENKIEELAEEIETVEIVTPVVNVSSINNDNHKGEDEEEEEEEKEEQIQQPIGVMDDFAAEALIIVDQIQKDLEQEDDDDDDDSQQQTESDLERSLNGNDIIVEIETENVSNVIESESQDVEKTPEVIISSNVTNAEHLIEFVSSVEENINEDIKETVTRISPISDSEMIERNDDIAIDLDSALSKLSISNEKSLHEIEKQIEMEIESNHHIHLFSVQANEYEEGKNSNQEKDEKIEFLIETTTVPAESENELNKEDCKSEIQIEPIAYSSDIIAEDKTTTSMMMMMNSDDKDDEFIISINKEIPSAKDLKENAAAAEITTQDLPVTCE